jgi:hypothetical protein
MRLLFPAKIITLLAVDIDCYGHYLDTLENGPSTVSDMTEYETSLPGYNNTNWTLKTRPPDNTAQ